MPYRGAPRPMRLRRIWPLPLACVVFILLSLWSIRQEMLVATYQTRLDRAADVPPAPDDVFAMRIPASAPARVYLAEALYIAQAAALADPADRSRLLPVARRSLRLAGDIRPHWGEYWVAAAFIESLAAPGLSGTERDALIRSYLDAPYMFSAGRWRVSRGLQYWSAFPPFAQERIVRETVWLIRAGNPRDRQGLLDMARESEGYAPVFNALRPASD